MNTNKTITRFAGANIEPFIKPTMTFLKYFLEETESPDFKKDRKRRY